MVEFGFDDFPVVEISSMGNIGNRAIQFLAASKIVEEIGRGKITGYHMEEFGYSAIENSFNCPPHQEIKITPDELFNIDQIKSIVNFQNIKKIRFWHYGQRMEYLPNLEKCRNLISKQTEYFPKLEKNDLLINIRGGEILEGVDFYPFIPYSFYKQILAKTRLNPVFMGQTDHPAVRSELKRHFPAAKIYGSLGVQHDFDFIRSADNIVISVSTFSWLAAYLSEAQNIYMVMAGLFNINHMKNIDLLPVNDARYHFYLFPFVFGQSYPDIIRHYNKNEFSSFLEVDHDYVQGMKDEKFKLPRNFEKEISLFQEYFYGLKYPEYKIAHDSNESLSPIDYYRKYGFQKKHVPHFFHEAFYMHRYVDAAIAVSLGQYDDAYHHYTAVGHSKGYLPKHPDSQNIALEKHITQSSKDVGGVFADGENAYFCTEKEPEPWWQIDLFNVYEIFKISIKNIDASAKIQKDGWPITIMASMNGLSWLPICWSLSNHAFGSTDQNCFMWYSWHKTIARYLRVCGAENSQLKFKKIEIFGVKLET